MDNVIKCRGLTLQLITVTIKFALLSYFTMLTSKMWDSEMCRHLNSFIVLLTMPFLHFVCIQISTLYFTDIFIFIS